MQKHTFSDNEKERVLQLLREAKFKESNRIGHGPTPEGVINLHFKGGKIYHFGFWGGDTFETSAKHLDSKSQFLVESKELGEFISKMK